MDESRWEQWRRDPRVIAAVVVLVVIAAAFAWSRSNGASSPRVAGTTTPIDVVTTRPSRALVHVVGAVVAPGVVELDAGARVLDALEAAGGAAADADVQQLNLAAPIADGQRVAVPRVGEVLPAPVEGAATPTGPLNLNAATAAELEALPGIGPSLAGAILAEREKTGRFESVDDLKRVRGIGEQRFADLKDLVTV